MAKCSICKSKKGKRECLRERDVICSLCCGETRIKESCSDCSHYKEPVVKRNYNEIPSYTTQEMENSFALQDYANVIEGELCAFDYSTGQKINDEIAIEIIERLLDHYYFNVEDLKFSDELVADGFMQVLKAIQKDLSDINEETLIKIIAVIRFVARRRSSGYRDYLSVIHTYVGARLGSGTRIIPILPDEDEIEPAKGVKKADIIGYSSLDITAEWYEYNEDSCLIADTIESAKTLGWGEPEDYRIDPVDIQMILDDYGASGKDYHFEVKAFERFKKKADALGVSYEAKKLLDFDEPLYHVEIHNKESTGE